MRYSQKLAFSWAALCLGYLHAPKLASLLDTGAGARACALLSASSTGSTSGTSVPPGALLIGPVMSLLFLAGDHGVLYGYTSTTSRLASLGAHSWYWRFSGAPSTDVSQTLALFVALSVDGVSGGGALRQRFSNPTGVVPSALLFWQVILRPSKLCSSLTGSYIPENFILIYIYINLLIKTLFPEILNRSIGVMVGLPFLGFLTSIMESLWEVGSYTGELMLC